MSIFVFFILCLLLAAYTAYLAKQKNRNPIIWFIIGFVFQPLGLLLIALLPAARPSSQESEKQREIAPVNLADAHSEAAAPTDNSRNLPPIKRIPTNTSILWFYVDDNQKIIGPLKIDELRKEIIAKRLDISTYIWCEEFDDWMQILEFQNSNILTDPDLVE